MVSVDYLEQERIKIWAEITDIKDKLDKKTPEYEKEARSASKKASEFKNRALESKTLVDDILSNLQNTITTLTSQKEDSARSFESIIRYEAEIQSKLALVSEIEEKALAINDLFEDQEQLSQKIASLQEISSSCEDKLSKINAALNNVNKRKGEFDTIYYEVMGYEQVNEGSGETEVIEGLKDKLDQAYDKLKADLEKTKKEIANYQVKVEDEYESKLKDKTDNFDQSMLDWQFKHDEVLIKIRSVLPDALTAGLSSAYSDKRKSEIIEGKELKKSFDRSIMFLIAASSIPFAISIYLFTDGRTVDAVLQEMPRLTLSILPLYIPLLWLAYSTSKKMNLSKRLVEEYTHKEVLSKTFEGLSSQIATIDQDLSFELRVKLLHNLLDTSSENPGKLISDYNNADHPIMDILDKSAKLGRALSKASKIPGIAKVTETLERKSVNKLAKEQINVETGLASVDLGRQRDGEAEHA